MIVKRTYRLLEKETGKLTTTNWHTSHSVLSLIAKRSLCESTQKKELDIEIMVTSNDVQVYKWWKKCPGRMV